MSGSQIFYIWMPLFERITFIIHSKSVAVSENNKEPIWEAFLPTYLKSKTYQIKTLTKVCVLKTIFNLVFSNQWALELQLILQSKIYVKSHINEGYWGIMCTAVIEAVACQGQDSLMEPIPLQAGFEINVFLLTDRLPSGKKAQSTLLFIPQLWGRRNGFILSPRAFVK